MVSLYVTAILYGLPFHIFWNCLVHIVALVVSVNIVLITRFSTAAVSHPPVVLAIVSLYVPATLYGFPFHIYGSWLVHTVALVVSVNIVLITRFSTAAVSQPPVVLAMVSLYVPATLYGLPFHIYGSWLVHSVALGECVDIVFISRISTDAVSHPPVVLAIVSLYVPATVYGLPYHIYGSWLVHTVALVVSVNIVLINRFSTAAVSHPPVVLAIVSLYVPATEYGLPFHIYGSWLVHTVALVVSVNIGLITRVTTAAGSHPPVVLAIVSLYVPATEYGLPFHIYGSWRSEERRVGKEGKSG